MGMFEMGSTIALIFECPKDYDVLRNPGDKVFLGDRLIDYVKPEEHQDVIGENE